MNTIILRNLFILVFLALSIYSCNDSDNKDGGYNPSKPIEVTSYLPIEGGMATKIILTGNNLGNDKDNIKVYFNDKRAAVIGCNAGKVLLVVPRQPGDICDVSVVVGKDSIVLPQQFTYHTRSIVTTLVGQKGVEAFKAGSFAEATLAKPSTLTIDNEHNLFLSMWGGDKNGSHVLINQEKREISLLANDGPYGAPGTDSKGEIVMVPSDGGDGLYVYDPATQWIPKKRQLIHPTDQEIAAGMVDFKIDYKHSIASSKLDDMAYTKGYSGQLVKFDPLTRKGQKVTDLMAGADTYLVFHPTQHNLLFLAYGGKGNIYTYDLLTNKHEHYAGSIGASKGWKDGPKESALFGTIYQLVFDSDNNMLVVDNGNHCIRKITADGVVSTVIGMPGKTGYQDGNPDDALFNNPRGLCIDTENNMYIADFGNNCIRKLSIE